MKKILLSLLLVILLLALGACTRTQTTETEAAPASESTSQEAAPQSTSQESASQETTGEQEAGPTNTPPAPTHTPGPTPTPTEIPPYVQTVGSFVAINEVGLGPQGYVSLTNFTSVPTTTQGLYICQGEACFALPDVVIEAGATGRVAVGDGEGLEGVIATNATIGELKTSDGEIALFASEKFDDPKALLVYFQWGSTPHKFTDLAVEAGLWLATGYAPTSPNATRLYRLEDSGWWVFEE